MGIFYLSTKFEVIRSINNEDLFEDRIHWKHTHTETDRQTIRQTHTQTESDTLSIRYRFEI